MNCFIGVTFIILCMSVLNTSAQQSDAINDTKEVKPTNVELLKSPTRTPERNQPASSSKQYDRTKLETMEKYPQAPVREGFATDELYHRAKREWIEKNPAAYERLNADNPNPAAFMRVITK